MKDNQMSTEPATIVISELVQSECVAEYETWVLGINQAVKTFNGFLGVDVIRPRDIYHLEYVVILKFNNNDNLNVWLASATCQRWLKKSQGLVVRETHFPAVSDAGFWFSVPKNDEQKAQPPAYYKMVILGILAVYPLVLLTNFMLAPILKETPYLLGVFISVVAICLLMTYPVLPWLEKCLNTWLYPPVNDKS